jgi:hypothetical protein
MREEGFARSDWGACVGLEVLVKTAGDSEGNETESADPGMTRDSRLGVGR